MPTSNDQPTDKPSSSATSLWRSLAFGLGASAPVAAVLAFGTITDSVESLVKAAERLGWPAVFVALMSYGVWQATKGVSGYLVPKFDAWFSEQTTLISTLREKHTDAIGSLKELAEGQVELQGTLKGLANGHVEVQGTLKGLAGDMGRLASAQEQATQQHIALVEGMARFGCVAASGVVTKHHHQLPMVEDKP